MLRYIINYLCTYGLYGPVHKVFDAGRYITLASGRGLGPGNGIKPIGVCLLGLKNSRLPGPKPLPLAHIMYLPASKPLHTGTYKS